MLTNITFAAESLIAEMADGTTVRAPIAQFPRLHAARPEERDNWRIVGGGEGVHLPSVDEDLPLESIVAAGLR